MSLILEALKKSEARRQLGAAPTLATPTTAPRRRRRVWPWLALGALALALGIGGSWWMRQASPPIVSAPPPDRAQANDAGSARPRPAGVETSPRQATAKPSANAATPPASSPAMPGAPPPHRVPDGGKPPAPQTAPVAAAHPPARNPAAPTVATTAPAAAPASQAAPNAAAPDVPTVDDLPAALRADLPDLPISMQVYAADPARRFIIVNGTRAVEGESYRGVTLREIRPNGVVLEFRSQRFLLPRPGA